MKVTFLGAAHEVTGSCTLIEVGDKRGLVDCGMEQGKDVIIIVPTIDMKGHYAMGDTVHFKFEGNVAHVFSKETEKNLEW